jgi:hypothetical protein
VIYVWAGNASTELAIVMLAGVELLVTTRNVPMTAAQMEDV